jgi:hypothetical protein
MTYYTLQLFCKMTENLEALQNVTRGFNKNLQHGRLIESRLTQLTQDIHNNWDTTYSVNLFPPAKEFDGKKVDAAKNRHILRVMFVDVPLIAELVKYFKEKYTKIKI